MNKTKIGYILFSAALLVGCTSKTPSANSGNTAETNTATEAEDVIHVADEGGGDAPAASSWNVSSETDPMSGNTVQTAAMDIQGQTFDIQAKVRCAAGPTISYEFLTFDKSGQPAELVTANHSWMGTVIPFEQRIGDAPARRTYSDNIRFSNQIRIVRGKMYIEDGLTSADRLTFRFFLRQGDETFVIDQTDAGLRAVLNACADTSPKFVGTEHQGNPQSEPSATATPAEPNAGAQTGDANSSGESPVVQGPRQ